MNCLPATGKPVPVCRFTHSRASPFPDELLALGDLVEHNGKHYYVQPEGLSCYLYGTSADAHNRRNRLLSAARSSIRKVSIAYHAAPRPPALSAGDDVGWLLNALMSLTVAERRQLLERLRPVVAEYVCGSQKLNEEE
jgi:hypothetical protein